MTSNFRLGMSEEVSKILDIKEKFERVKSFDFDFFKNPP